MSQKLVQLNFFGPIEKEKPIAGTLDDLVDQASELGVPFGPINSRWVSESNINNKFFPRNLMYGWYNIELPKETWRYIAQSERLGIIASIGYFKSTAVKPRREDLREEKAEFFASRENDPVEKTVSALYKWSYNRDMDFFRHVEAKQGVTPKPWSLNKRIKLLSDEERQQVYDQIFSPYNPSAQEGNHGSWYNIEFEKGTGGQKQRLTSMRNYLRLVKDNWKYQNATG